MTSLRVTASATRGSYGSLFWRRACSSISRRSTRSAGRQRHAWSRLLDTDRQLDAEKAGRLVLENGPKGTPRRYKLVLADETAGVATSGWRDALEEHIAFYSSSGGPQVSQPARQKTKAKKKPSAISEEEEVYSAAAAAAAAPPPPPPPPAETRPRADESDPVHAVMYANGKEHFKAREYDTALECFESCAKLLGGGQAMSYRQLQSYLQQARELSSNGSVAGSMSRNQSRQGSLVGSSVNGLARVVAEATRANDPRFASLSHTPSPRDTGNNNSRWPSVARLSGDGVDFLSLDDSNEKMGCFLSYRVSSEAKLVSNLFYRCRSLGMNMWWDHVCLRDGVAWEDGFVDGLMACSVYVPVLSKSGLARFSDLTSSSPVDNLFLEMRIAVELLDRGEIERIFPILVGDLKHIQELGDIYTDFFQAGSAPICPDVSITSVEVKATEHLKAAGLGELRQNGSVKRVLDVVLSHNGHRLEGKEMDTVDKAVARLHDVYAQLAVDMQQGLGAEGSEKGASVHSPVGSEKEDEEVEVAEEPQKEKQRQMSVAEQIRRRVKDSAQIEREASSEHGVVVGLS